MSIFIPLFIQSLKPILDPASFKVALYLRNVIAERLCGFRKLIKQCCIIVVKYVYSSS